MTARTGGQVLVDQLLIHGVSKIFCVPGESYLAAMDAMYDVDDRIDLYVCRQEGGAATMAEAYGKLTGEPGVCFVTRGPGATNASVAVHIAQQDSTPMVLSSVRSTRRTPVARRSRSWITYGCSAGWRSGPRRSTTPPACRR